MEPAPYFLASIPEEPLTVTAFIVTSASLKKPMEPALAMIAVPDVLSTRPVATIFNSPVVDVLAYIA